MACITIFNKARRHAGGEYFSSDGATGFQAESAVAASKRPSTQPASLNCIA
jgi:hypothetical protein